MSKAGERILACAREAHACVRGEDIEGFVVHVPGGVDVRAIRKKLGLTRAEFADRFGFSPDAVKEWEIGGRTPSRSARVLLQIVEREPEAVLRALAS
jgi:putative transcriptional regulator